MDAPTPQPQPPPLRILLVEDHLGLRTLMAQALTRHLGADVVQADDLPQALDHASARTFDVFLMDLNLPTGSAFDAVPALRGLSPRARIVLMSAGVTPADRARATTTRVDALIDKAEGPSALANAVSAGQLLQGHDRGHGILDS